MKIAIRLPNWIGDVCMLVPSIEVIKKNFKNVQIDVYGRKPSLDVLENYPGIKRLIDLPRKKINELGEFFKNRKSGYDIAFTFANSFISAFEIFLLGAKERIGYKNEGRSLLLTHSYDKEFSLSYHFSNYYLNLLEKFGLKTNNLPKPRLYLSEVEKEEAEKFFNEFLNSRYPVVGIAPGAAYGSSKMWGREKFRRLSVLIKKEYKNSNVILFGSKNDKDVCDYIQDGERKSILNLCGKTTIRSAMALIEKTSVFISNDSGLMHVASLLGVPVIAIFGPTSPQSTHPLNKPYKIFHKKVYCSPCGERECRFDFHLCMEVIREEEVLLGLKEFV